MGRKRYDQNGDVILSADQLEICRLANYLYDVVDRLFILEDENENFDLHPAVQVYQTAIENIEKILEHD